MNKNSIIKAGSRLRAATNTLDRLRGETDIVKFADEWYLFLTAAKNVYSQLEQGAKASDQSHHWFGAQKKIRKEDPLLQYFFQARNDDEHGLDIPVGKTLPRTDVGVAEPGSSKTIRLDGGQIHNFVAENCGVAASFEGGLPDGLKVTSLDGKPISIRHYPSQIVLKTVTGRGNVKYNPPTTHLGKHLTDQSPVALAALVLEFLAALIEEADNLA